MNQSLIDSSGFITFGLLFIFVVIAVCGMASEREDDEK